MKRCLIPKIKKKIKNMKKLFFLLIFLSGCAPGPDYHEPKMSMPKKFLEQRDDDSAVVSLRNWWKTFHDDNLNAVVRQAIESNFDLKIALEKIEQARAYYRIKKADLFPEIDMTAGAVRYRISQNAVKAITDSFVPQDAFNIFQIGFDAVWEIDVFGRLRREKQAACYDFLSYQENMRNVYVTMVSDAARYYADICALQNIISLTRKKIEYQKNILDLISDKKTNGLDSGLIVNNEIIILKQEEENLLYYSTVLKQSVYRLCVLIGRQPEKCLDLSRFTTIPDAEDKVPLGLPSNLLRDRPDIRHAEKQLARSTAKIGAAIAQYFPSFSLISDPAYSAGKVSDLFSSNSLSWSIGSIMKWPIINFGRIRADVDQKKAEQRQALLAYEQTVLKALEDTESSFAAYFNEARKLKKTLNEVQASAENTLLSYDKYMKGIISLIEYLIQKKSLIDLQIKEKESRRILCHNLIALYKALGGGEWQKTEIKDSRPESH